MAKVETPANPLLRLGNELKEEHLAELEADIAATETRLAGLKRLRTVALAMLGKATPRKAPKPRGESGKKPFDLDAKRRELAKAILRSGPLTGHQLINEHGVSPRVIGDLMQYPWFDKNGQGWHLTPLGRQANG